MNTYISLLRGINVSGKNLIKMDLLTQLFIEFGFENVETYIQSGNIVFTSKDEDLIEIEEKIYNGILEKFNLNISVIIIKLDDFQNILNHCHFTKLNDIDEKNIYISFLSEESTNYDKTKILAKKNESELIEFSEKAIYLYCPTGYGNTKISNNFLESALKVSITTRNWNTCNKLLEIGNKINNIKLQK